MKAPPIRLSRPDLAILGFFSICGVLAALSSDREFLDFREWSASQPSIHRVSSARPFEAVASRAVQDLEAVLYAISPGLALIAYRPRRSTRLRRRGPGQVALAVAGGLVSLSVAFFCWFTYGPSQWTGSMPNGMPGRPSTFWIHLPHGFGIAITRGIVSAWVYLAVIRGWRARGSPPERLGRWLGLTWILASIASWGIMLIPAK